MMKFGPGAPEFPSNVPALFRSALGQNIRKDIKTNDSGCRILRLTAADANKKTMKLECKFGSGGSELASNFSASFPSALIQTYTGILQIWIPAATN